MATDLGRIAIAAEARTSARPERSMLVGRQREMVALEAALADLRSGASIVLEICGEAGIGKSRLLAELGALAAAEGCLVLSGRAGEFERDEPFSVFRDALDDHVVGLDARLLKRLGRELLGELGACLPALAALGYEPEGALESERYRTHRAVRALLEAMAIERPLVLLLDDLHWADEPSLELLGALLRRRPRGRVLLACAHRPHQASRRLTEALADDVETLALSPLELDAVRALLGAGFDEGCVEALHELSAGVPFYLEELARVGPVAAGVEDAASTFSDVPRAVEVALRAELETLGEAASRLLRGAAVAGDPFEFALAAAAAGLDERDALGPLDELVDRDLVRATERSRRLRFRHPIVRHAVYASASPGFRIAAHGRAAAALERSGAPPQARAHHLAASAEPGDERAAALLTEAGQAAAARAPGVAARWFEEALRVHPDADPGWRLGLLAARARVLVASGRLEAGLEAIDEALSLAGGQAHGLMADLTAAAAAVENLLGRHAEARARLRAALDAWADPASAEAAALHFELAGAAVLSRDRSGELFSHARLAAHAAAAAEDDLLAAAADAALAYGELDAGRFDAAVRLVAQAGPVLERCTVEALAERLEAPLYLGHIAYFVERVSDSDRWFSRAIAASRKSGRGDRLVPLMNGQTLALATLGRLVAADELASAALDAARLDANPQALAWTLWLRSWVSLQRGELPDALRTADEFAALVRTLAPSLPTAMGAWAVGGALLEAGQPARTRALVLELGGGDALPHILPPLRCLAYEVLTRAALAAQRPEEAEGWAAHAERSARSPQGGLAAAVAGAARAAVLLEHGQATDAAEVALSAADWAARPGARIESARARLLAGRALAAAGDRERAVPELERAEAELAQCGARRLRDAAAADLRALGRRVKPSGGARTDGGALSTLSRREHEVAELVATGLANKEIAATLHISINTVESHLKRIFAKLEVRNRTAVAAARERER